MHQLPFNPFGQRFPFLFRVLSAESVLRCGSISDIAYIFHEHKGGTHLDIVSLQE